MFRLSRFNLLKLSLLLVTLTVLKGIDKGILQMFSHDQTILTSFGKKHHRSTILIILYQGYRLAIGLIITNLTLITYLIEVVFVRFFYFKVTHPPCSNPWKEVTLCSPHLRSRELRSTALREGCINDLEFFCIEDSSIPPFINIYFFNYLYYGMKNIYFILWVIC